METNSSSLDQGLFQGIGKPARQRPSPSEEESRPRPLLKLAVAAFGIFAFFFFLALKLPEARIQNLVIAHCRILAQDHGMLFSAEKVRVGMIFGPSIRLYNVELKSIDDERQTLKIPYLRIRPRLLSLMGATKKAGISAELLDGSISGTVGAGPTAFLADLSLDSLDLGKGSLLRKFLPVEATAVVDGSIDLGVDLDQVQKTEGSIKLEVTKLALPAQQFMGFNLPKVSIGSSKLEISIAQGQALIRELTVGQDLKTDDLVAKVTGDVALDRSLDRSRVNVKAVFGLSSAVTQSFPLLDALLGPAKTGDGKYTYRINGTLSALDAQPGS